MANTYLKNAGSIDVYNHVGSESRTLEDIWKSFNPHRFPLTGIIGFCFTNEFLITKHFNNGKILHPYFKMRAANPMATFQDSCMCKRRFLNISHDEVIHSLSNLSYSVLCCYCQHGSDTPVKKEGIHNIQV